MLQIEIPESELWDEGRNEFINLKQTTLQLEHSLVSLSKWESKWKKPFLTKEDKSIEELTDYIRCMTVTQNVNPVVYNFLPNNIFEQVKKYIDDSMTATWFSDEKKSKAGSSEQITAEIIYYWMISLNIPFECQKWHLNRLFTLIKVCNIKNQKGKKMPKKEIFSQNSEINRKRREAMNSKG